MNNAQRVYAHLLQKTTTSDEKQGIALSELKIYRSAGGFEARARAYWHAHIKDAVEGEQSMSMMDAADELQQLGRGNRQFGRLDRKILTASVEFKDFAAKTQNLPTYLTKFCR